MFDSDLSLCRLYSDAVYSPPQTVSNKVMWWKQGISSSVSDFLEAISELTGEKLKDMLCSILLE